MPTVTLLSIFTLLACGTDHKEKETRLQERTSPSAQTTNKDYNTVNGVDEKIEDADNNEDNNSVRVVVNPTSTAVLVNKHFTLPESYAPSDLVYPDVPFIFNEKIEKRMLRREAAEALKQLVAGAKADGIYIAGVSGYRSYATQKALFNAYVEKDGIEKARTYSAVPGTSEHETGLAIDVSGSTGRCAAQDCFADTKEATWLAKHSAEYGFIIRYPKGKEAITGYQYEPWHIRYVGKKVAQEINNQGSTLEEYLDEVPVSE